jgi:hypothetical protein
VNLDDANPPNRDHGESTGTERAAPAEPSVLEAPAAEDHDEAWGDRSGARDDDWYERERPPHHE